eukprot:13334236-Alexandrium_andersonii.AAC.1
MSSNVSQSSQTLPRAVESWEHPGQVAEAAAAADVEEPGDFAVADALWASPPSAFCAAARPAPTEPLSRSTLHEPGALGAEDAPPSTDLE